MCAGFRKLVGLTRQGVLIFKVFTSPSWESLFYQQMYCYFHLGAHSRHGPMSPRALLSLGRDYERLYLHLRSQITESDIKSGTIRKIGSLVLRNSRCAVKYIFFRNRERLLLI